MTGIANPSRNKRPTVERHTANNNRPPVLRNDVGPCFILILHRATLRPISPVAILTAVAAAGTFWPAAGNIDSGAFLVAAHSGRWGTPNERKRGVIQRRHSRLPARHLLIKIFHRLRGAGLETETALWRWPAPPRGSRGRTARVPDLCLAMAAQPPFPPTVSRGNRHQGRALRSWRGRPLPSVYFDSGPFRGRYGFLIHLLFCHRLCCVHLPGPLLVSLAGRERNASERKNLRRR